VICFEIILISADVVTSSMRISIQHLLSGAARARGICVLIDVFRSSNTMLAMFGSGVKKIIQVKEVEEALALKKKNPGWLLFGERDGTAPPGFDFGNSPVEAERVDLKGKTAILCTSAGSAGIWAMKDATKIFIASFANAGAVIKHFKQYAGQDVEVTMVAIGIEGNLRAPEDELCTEYLKAGLEGRQSDLEVIRNVILAGPTARRLRERGQEDDLEFCLRSDIYGFLPRIYKENGLLTVRKQ